MVVGGGWGGGHMAINHGISGFFLTGCFCINIGELEPPTFLLGLVLAEVCACSSGHKQKDYVCLCMLDMRV